MGFQEVTAYMYLSPVRQPCELNFGVANKDRWAELSPDLQEIVNAECFKAGMDFYFSLRSQDAKAINKWADYGVAVGPMAKDVTDEMARQAEIFYAEETAKDPFYAEVLNSIRDAAKSAEDEGVF
ncbi:hypothetical protein ES708_13734 [subsurface metagenome]